MTSYTSPRHFPQALSDLQFRLAFKHPEIKAQFDELARPIYKAAGRKVQNVNVAELLRIEARLLQDTECTCTPNTTCAACTKRAQNNPIEY